MADTADHSGIDALVALDMDTLKCPYPAFSALREVEPISWSESMGCWIVTDYEVLKRVLVDTDSFSNKNAGGPQTERSGLLQHVAALAQEPEHQEICQRFFESTSERPRVLISADPPEHIRQRRLVNGAFRPSAMRDMEPEITELVDGLLDDILGPAGDQFGGTLSLDLVQPFSVLVPMAVIATALGVPDGDYDRFKFWSDALLVALGNAHVTPEQALALVTAQVELDEYFDVKLRERAANPQSDIISDVATAELDGDRLGIAEQTDIVRQFLQAGNETTTKLLSNGVKFMCEFPDVQARLRSDRSLIAPFIEEALRHESPVTGLFRSATRDVEIGGVTVREGEFVWAAYSAANHDGAKFANPDAFDLDRFADGQLGADHLAFGHGEHFCIGARLARTEARIAFERLLDRTTDIRLTPGANDFAVNRSFVLRGIEALHVDIDPA
jgi:cytochrome P450